MSNGNAQNASSRCKSFHQQNCTCTITRHIKSWCMCCGNFLHRVHRSTPRSTPVLRASATCILASPPLHTENPRKKSIFTIISTTSILVSWHYPVEFPKESIFFRISVISVLLSWHCQGIGNGSSTYNTQRFREISDNVCFETPQFII